MEILPLSSHSAQEGFVCLQEEKQQFIPRSCSHTPSCYPRQEWIYTCIHTYVNIHVYIYIYTPYILLLCTPKSMKTPYFHSDERTTTCKPPLETHVLLELG